MHNEAFLKLESLENEYVTFWAELCKIESPTDDKAAVDEAGRFIIEKAKALGFSVKVKNEELSGNPFVVTMNGGSEELPLVFDRFHKLDKSRSENRDGWGLGSGTVHRPNDYMQPR